jgi:hypothetical protein
MRSLLTSALMVCLVSALQAADDENPLKKSKVGDWVEYKTTTEIMSQSIEGTMKMTITAKTEKEATLEVKTIISVMGNEREMPAQKQKIDLTKPYDFSKLNSMGKLPKGGDAKVEKVGDGKEKITIGGKSYETNWTKMKTSNKLGDNTIETETKVWMSKDAPLSGMVKMEMKSSFFNMTMQLSGSGSK